MQFAKTSAAVHWWWVTAHLHEQQIFIGVVAVTQASCEPVCRAALIIGECILPWEVLQSIGVGSLQLYEQQILIGAIAVHQACCELVLQSSTEQWGNTFCPDQCCRALVLGHCTLV